LAGFTVPQTGDFNTANILAYIIFGGIGFVAFVYGKKNKILRPMLIGCALMGYPYFFTGTLVLYIIGVILTAALYFWRE
jgi:LPXTG-motif cell wall-anchored protein